MTDKIKFDIPVTSKEQEDALRKEREKKLWDSMKPHERLADFSKKIDEDPYARSRMSMSFPTIRAIKHVDGFILVVIDEKKAFERAVKIAEESLPPDASPVEINEYANKIALKTAAIPPKIFKNNLRYIMDYAAHSPFYLANDLPNKSDLKDLFSDATAALREAYKYRKQHPEGYALDNMYGDRRFNAGECKVTPENFALVFGKNWKDKLGEDLMGVLDVNIYDDKDSLILH